MLSLPRDLWVSIPGAGEGKINSAYLIGEAHGQGAALARQTVSNLLGITIDYTVVIDFAGFRSLIDALGGVPVDVPQELYDRQFPTDDYGYTVAHFRPGVDVMDGARALMFSRIRHPDSDFQRMRRQQLVLQGIARKLRERGALANLHAADQITAALRPFVQTDLPPALALDLLWSMRSLDPGQVSKLVADTSILTESHIGGAYVLIAAPKVLPSLAAQLVATH
jgi:LCP family protein required for cell wall assembly